MPRMTRVVLLALSVILLPGVGSAAGGSLSERAQSIRAAAERETAIAKQEAADSWITLKTKLALLASEGVNGLDVKVSTQHRVVILRGKVDSESAREAAEQTARRVKGQHRVINELVVVPKAARLSVDRQDAQIVQDVENRPQSDPGLHDSKIAVRADDGIVTLTGRAPSLEASVQASENARRVPGVRAVHNDLALASRG
jgi:hyperosmotically inducible periplasmic protein